MNSDHLHASVDMSLASCVWLGRHDWDWPLACTWRKFISVLPRNSNQEFQCTKWQRDPLNSDWALPWLHQKYLWWIWPRETYAPVAVTKRPLLVVGQPSENWLPRDISMTSVIRWGGEERIACEQEHVSAWTWWSSTAKTNSSMLINWLMDFLKVPFRSDMCSSITQVFSPHAKLPWQQMHLLPAWSKTIARSPSWDLLCGVTHNPTCA